MPELCPLGNRKGETNPGPILTRRRTGHYSFTGGLDAWPTPGENSGVGRFGLRFDGGE